MYGGEKKKEKTERRIFTITERHDYPQKPRFYEEEVRLLPILLLLLYPSGKSSTRFTRGLADTITGGMVGGSI